MAKRHFMIIFVLLVTLIGCQSPTQPQPQPLPQPRLIDWQPGSIDAAPLNSVIELRFDQPMDLDSVRAAFHLTPTVPLTVTTNGNEARVTTFASPFASPLITNTAATTIVRFTPQRPLEKGTCYQLVLDPTAHGANGQAVTASFTGAFTTTGQLKAATYPIDGAVNVPIDTYLSVSFDVPVSSTTKLALTASPSIGDLAGEWVSARRYRVPKLELRPATRYTVSVLPGAQTVTGEKLLNEVTATFTTTLPQVAAYSPQGFQVRPSSIVSLTFNMPVITGSVESRFALYQNDGRPVTGSLSWPFSTTLVFRPTKPLIEGEKYTVKITAGIQTPLGDAASDRAFDNTFTVAPLPEMIGSDPVDGDLRASIGDRVTLRFNMSMDTVDVEGALHITPMPDAPRFEWRSDNTVLDIVFAIDPTVQYTLALDGTARDEYGRGLRGNRSVVFQAAPQKPVAWLVGPRGYWNNVYGSYNPYPTVKQYTQFRNVNQLTYRLSSITRDEFLSMVQPDWYSDQKKPHNTFIMSWTQIVSASMNQIAYASTEVTLPNGQPPAPGVYLLEVTGNPGAVTDWRVLIVSPINLALKRSDKQIVVWSTDLRTGRPIADLPLIVYDQQKQVVTRGRTNDVGVLLTTETEQCTDRWECAYGWRPLYVTTDETAANWGFVASNWDQGIATRDFRMPYYYGEPSHTVFLYSDRPIYRPAQTVYFKGVIRQDNDGRFSLPQMITIPVTIQDAQGNEIYRQDLPLTDMGTFSGEVQLAAEAALGSYTIQAAFNPDEETAHGNFRVAEYRKPEFKVSVTPAITRPIDGDVVTVTVQADYYFGAPLPNATVEWRLSSDDYYYSLPEAWYSFGDVDEYYWLWGEENNRGENLYANGSGKTDANGTFTFTLPIDLSKAKRSQVLTFEADVTDQNHQVTSARGYAVASKSDLYVGARPRWYVTKPKEFLDIQLVAANPDHQRLANVPLTVEVYEREWKSARVRDSYGVYYWRSAYSDTLIATQIVTTTANGEVTAIVSAPRGGEYRVVARGRDAHGFEAVASTFFWTWGGDYVNWGIQNDDRVNVIADKRTYQPGDTARLLITAPFADSTALISVERGGVLRYWTQHIASTSALIEVPIHADYAPNVFVSVILLKGQAPDFPAADFKIGYAALNVDLTQQQLKVELIPDRARDTIARYAPRDTAAYTVRVTDYLGHPVDAEVSLSLIDAAVLALVGDEDRDILSAFYRQRGLGVHNSLTLITSVDRLTAILDKKAKGGGGGNDEVATRELFADTAFWKANVRTGPTGETTVYVTLPDNLTMWRMRAKAVSADTRLGQGEVDVIATQDILLRPVLPRFFTIGDQAQIGAIVHNYTLMTETLKVSCMMLVACGEAQTVTIGPNGSVPVYWDVRGPQALSVTVTLKAITTDGRGDAVKLTLPINAFFEDVPYVNYQPITTTQTITVALPPDVDRQFDELVIEVEPSLAAGIDSGLEYLVGFPYGCVEQTMSSFLPDVVVMRLIQQIDLDLRPGFREQLGAMIESGLQRLYGYQHNDGGWGWWKDDESNPSITTYVLYGLHQMELGGRAIEVRVRDNAAQYLSRWLRSTAIDAPIGSVHGAQFVSTGVNVRAFALYVLAELGQGDPGLSGKLYEQRDKLDHYGKAFLALALYLSNGNQTDDRIATLLQELRDTAKTDGRSVFWQDKVGDDYGMSTSTRTTAIAIDAFTRLALTDPSLDPAVRWLMMQRQDGHWQTTQETSMSLVALTEYLGATFERDGDYTYTVRVNGREIATVKVTPETLGKHGKWIIPIADLTDIGDVGGDGDPVVEITRSDGPGAAVRASVSLRHYRASDITPIDDRGVHVSRTYTVEKGKALSDLTVGDIVTVTLSVRFDQRSNYVIVEDPLPAGLEAIDTSLATTAQNLGPQIRDWRDWVWSHVELRDDRVALFATWMYYDNTLTYTYQARATMAGTFNVLPLQAYAMYKPEVIGRTSGLVVTVKEK